MQSGSESEHSPQLLLNRKALDVEAAKRGVHTAVELAAALGVDRTNLWRVSRGVPPSNRFIASIAIAFPGIQLNTVLRLQGGKK